MKRQALLEFCVEWWLVLPMLYSAVFTMPLGLTPVMIAAWPFLRLVPIPTRQLLGPVRLAWRLLSQHASLPRLCVPDCGHSTVEMPCWVTSRCRAAHGRAVPLVVAARVGQPVPVETTVGVG
jgi:hypothetical protein